MDIPDEYISIVGYLDEPFEDAAALASQILDASAEWTSGTLASLRMRPSLTADRRYDEEPVPPFWEREKRYGSLIKATRPRRIAGVQEVLAEAPRDCSDVRISWSRRRGERERHFPLWHLLVEPREPIDEEGDDQITAVGLHVCRDLVADPASVQRVARRILELLCGRGCYHAIIDVAPEQHVRGGYHYMISPRYMPVTWLRLVNDELWRSLGPLRHNSVRGSCWGTYLHEGILDRLGPGFRDEFLQWPASSDGVKTQAWLPIGGGALLLLSENIFEVSEFGREGKHDPYPLWFGANPFCAQHAAWLRLRLQQAGIIVV